MSIPENFVPILPLRDIVVFPHMIVPLFVGREKSIKALEAVMNEDKKVLLLAQKDGSTEDPSEKDLYKIGTIGNILQLLKLPDGTVKVLVEGISRACAQKFNSKDYLSASVSEGMSNALLESMSLGVPGVVSNVSGVDEIIVNNKTGLIFEMRNDKLLYQQLINAINISEDDYTKMSNMASEHIFKNFSIDQISKRYVKLYSHLIKK